MMLGAAVDRSHNDLGEPQLFLRRLQEYQDYEAQKQQVRQEGKQNKTYKRSFQNLKSSHANTLQ